VNIALTRQIHSDAKKRRSFLALLFAAGDLRRYALLTDTHNVNILYV